MSRFLSIIGIATTVAYIAALCWFFDGRLIEIKGMPPNNIGDFLAGVFGPLAILWLILGFFQQGVELRQNTRALDMQAEELRNSVEQQKSLVDVSRKQMEAEIEAIRFERERQAASARPKFIFYSVTETLSMGKKAYASKIKNLGNTASHVEFVYEPEVSSSTINAVSVWAYGEERHLEWKYRAPQAEYDIKLTIHYLDATGTPGTQAFQFVSYKQGDNFSVKISQIGDDNSSRVSPGLG